MRKDSLLYVAFALIILLGALNYVALTYSLYWNIWWFDSMMHFLAGLGGALCVVWFIGEPETPLRSVLIPILCLMVVGIIWELFEYAHGIAVSMENYMVDTSTDLFMDALGAYLATIFARTPKLP